MQIPDQKAIASLQNHPGFIELKDWVKEMRQEFFVNLGKELYANPDAVTEASLREKRAYWKGMARLLNEPFFSLQSVTRDITDDRGDSV